MAPSEPALCRSRRRLLKVAVAGFALLQVGQLFAGPYRVWPFCAYDMFALREGSHHVTLAVTLEDDAGQWLVAAPGRVLPLEFFRAAAILERVFMRGTDEAQKSRLAARILADLNERPWSTFDEVWAPVRPADGRRLVRMQLLRLEQGIDRGARGVKLSRRRAEVIYDSGATTGGAE
jgi:hypothetical protein